jgi:non-lysosomal glucosylceramidase
MTSSAAYLLPEEHTETHSQRGELGQFIHFKRFSFAAQRRPEWLNGRMTAMIPSCAWQRPLGLGWDKPYTVRYASNLDDGPWHGAPLGGFGAGCIGRSPRGDFNLWHLDGGEHLFRSLPACQFSVFEQGTGAYALSTQPPEDDSLASWQWYPASTTETDTGEYAALYPRSWFVYRNVFKAELSCEQYTPILPQDYQVTSYPVALFRWTALNPTDAPLTLSILLTWQNSAGWFTNTNKALDVIYRDDGSPVYDYIPAWGQSAGNWNELQRSEGWTGIVLGNGFTGAPDEGDGQWAIATVEQRDIEVFWQSRWNPRGDGSEIWTQFSQDGSLANTEDPTPAQAQEQLAGAIAVRFTLHPGQTLDIPFALAWDFPVTEFAQGVRYLRRYTDFFGSSGHQAWAIATDALSNWYRWQQQIIAWQTPIAEHPTLPAAIRMALLNELYDLSSGGSLWSAATEQDPVGQFAVLECLDYAWYESLDVRLYGSFGLLLLWPELEKAVLRAFARAIPQSDARTRVIGYWFTIGQESPLAPRKLADATPHDLGAPNEHPWEKTNYTGYQDCNLWKDLGSDYVLQVWRDYKLTGADDLDFLIDCWPSVVRALRFLKGFDLDGDGIPENSGAPDQTFDDWRLQGISAYCGGLWIAALEAALAMAAELEGQLAAAELTPHVADFRHWLSQARALYHPTLWNSQYYWLDSGSGSAVVMADQLCGDFYARILDLPEVVPVECARQALQTVYDACFLKFHDGQYGAANGLLPDGSPVDPKGTHPLEVWTGINFGLAAYLQVLGFPDQALHLTETVIQQIYTNGLQFRTPEAITANATFRACHYLRAMAIWAVWGVSTDFKPVVAPQAE